jgi:dTDP-4-amino-4,6-dideoxygalactose transaminase
MRALNEEQIFPRRYFYPSLNKLNYVAHQSMPISENIASRILCLPLAHDLKDAQVEAICAIILSNLNKDAA